MTARHVALIRKQIRVELVGTRQQDIGRFELEAVSGLERSKTSNFVPKEICVDTNFE